MELTNKQKVENLMKANPKLSIKNACLLLGIDICDLTHENGFDPFGASDIFENLKDIVGGKWKK
ncbi:MAG: hypothetical protein GY936_14235 [Ignavibacteriae bacterium]|nr:hypothetical protein [Ignavibacteriota bacterium]